MDATRTEAAASAASYRRLRPGTCCPQCRGPIFRTWRRPVDRLTSHFVPVHRYRCESFGCQWVGNLRVARADFVATDGRFVPLQGRDGSRRDDALPLSFVIYTSLALAGFLVLTLLGTTDLYQSEIHAIEQVPPSHTEVAVSERLAPARAPGSVTQVVDAR